MRTPRHFFIACIVGSSLLFQSNAKAQDIPTLLSSQRYSEAFQEAKRLPTANIISQVQRLAQGNDAPAQWILADAYWRAGQKEQAVHWGYTALISTRLDASGCRYPKHVVPWMMQSYEYIFSEARRRPDLLSGAVKKALAQHAKQSDLPTDQAWACRLGAYLSGAKNDSALRMPSEATLKRRRLDALKDLAKNAKVKLEVAAR